MTHASKAWVVRGALIGVIGLGWPLKSWLEDESVRVGRPQSQRLISKESAQPILSGEARKLRGMESRVPEVNQQAEARVSEANHDLSSPGISVPTPTNSQANHSPSLAALSGGSLAMTWFGGSREGARDVQIFFAKFDGAGWSGARAIMGTDQLMRQTGRYLTKLGNPMLYFDGERLHCWFVSVSLGGWGGARLNHMVSLDDGEHWSAPKLLVASPFLNVSTLVRSTALPALSSTELSSPSPKALVVSRETLLPAYFELSHKYPVMLRVDVNSRILDRYPFGGRTGLLQPSVIRVPSVRKPVKVSNETASASATEPATILPDTTLIALFRRGQAVSDARVFTSRSLDNGQTWSDAEPIGIPNGDASVVAWADRTKIWLVANPDLESRRSIASYELPDSLPFLANLAPSRILDQVPASLPGHQEFSYPSFAKTSDGRLHLVYTADGRKGIRHRIWAPQPNLDPMHRERP